MPTSAQLPGGPSRLDQIMASAYDTVTSGLTAIYNAPGTFFGVKITPVLESIRQFKVSEYVPKISSLHSSFVWMTTPTVYVINLEKNGSKEKIVALIKALENNDAVATAINRHDSRKEASNNIENKFKIIQIKLLLQKLEKNSNQVSGGFAYEINPYLIVPTPTELAKIKQEKNSAYQLKKSRIISDAEYETFCSLFKLEPKKEKKEDTSAASQS
ncbi:MAG: hypothetical protein ACOYK6_05315 [Chthoniobacterales bacterium]